jgi:hypothetical protein
MLVDRGNSNSNRSVAQVVSSEGMISFNLHGSRIRHYEMANLSPSIHTVICHGKSNVLGTRFDGCDVGLRTKDRQTSNRTWIARAVRAWSINLASAGPYKIWSNPRRPAGRCCVARTLSIADLRDFVNTCYRSPYTLHSFYMLSFRISWSTT